MPQVTLQICLFHVLRTFCREITTNKLNIPECERQGILQIIEKIAYCHSEEEYNNLNIQFLRACPNKALKKYYDTNWHAIKEPWCNFIKRKLYILDKTQPIGLKVFFCFFLNKRCLVSQKIYELDANGLD